VIVLRALDIVVLVLVLVPLAYGRRALTLSISRFHQTIMQAATS
jgi:hypothetical protein